MEYQIRKVKQSDLAALADVEACCFPVSEAASKEAIQKRLETFFSRTGNITTSISKNNTYIRINRLNNLF